MSAPLVAPGRGQGLRDVVRHWYLLRLIVRKEVQVRYRGSVLGIVWSYIKPAVQFAVFYVAMGVFLGLNKGMPNYAVYLFSGIAVMNFFNEAFGNAARSVVGNGQLIITRFAFVIYYYHIGSGRTTGIMSDLLRSGKFRQNSKMLVRVHIIKIRMLKIR